MAGLLQFDPNDPANALLAGPASAGVQTLTPQQAPVMTPDQIASVRMASTGVGGLLSGLKDATYTPDGNGMTFWDKLGAFGQTLSHAQSSLDGTLGGAAGGADPGMATLQAYKDKAAQQAQRQQAYALGQQLFPNDPAKAMLFATNPDFQKAASEAYGKNMEDTTVNAGDTRLMHGAGGAVNPFMAAKLGQHGDQTYTQGAGGIQVTGQLAQTPEEIAALQNAQNGAVTANKPQVVSEGASLVQSGVAPSLIPGMPQAAATGAQPRVLYTAPKTYAPTAGGADIGPSATDDDLITNLAQQVAGGGALPPLGVGKSAVALKTAILSRAAQIQKAGGIDGFNALYGKGDNKAQTAALVKQANIRNAMQQAEQQANANIDAGLAVARNGGAAPGIPFVGGLIQQGRRAANDPKATQAHAFLDTAGEELAKVTSGSMGNTAATDSARAAAKSRLSDSMSLPALEAAAKAAKVEMHNRVVAAQAAEDELRRRIVEGSYGQNKTMGAGVNQPSAADQLRAKSAATRGAAPGWQIVGVQ